MEIELVILLGAIILALAYFIFRKPKDAAIPEDVVKTEQYTPEPIGGVPVVAAAPVEPEPTPAPTAAPAQPTVTFIPEVTQAVENYVEEVKPAPVAPKKQTAAKTPAKPKPAAIKAKKKK